MRFIRKVLFCLLILIVIIVLARNVVFKVGVEQGVQAITGLPLRMEKLDIGLTTTSMQIKGLRIYNPDGFPDKVMLDMPEIYVDYDLMPLLQKKVFLSEVRINLKEFMVVKNKEGAVNLDALKNLQTEKEPEVKKEKSKTSPPELKIDLLELKIGKVVSKDYSSGDEPSVQEFNINIDERFEDITNVNALVSIIVFKALANTSVGALLDIDLGAMKDAVTGTLSGAKDVAIGTLKTTTGILKKTTQGLKEAL